MRKSGLALMGTGVGVGPQRAVEAASLAVNSPLLDDIAIRGAMGILINITGGPELTLHEVNAASSAIAEEAHEDANIIFGSVVDENAGDEVRITVIATGFEQQVKKARPFTPPQQRRESRTSELPARAADDRDIPTHIRQRWENQPRLTRDLSPMVDEHPSLDIPTFLRRQAD